MYEDTVESIGKEGETYDPREGRVKSWHWDSWEIKCILTKNIWEIKTIILRDAIDLESNRSEEKFLLATYSGSGIIYSSDSNKIKNKVAKQKTATIGSVLLCPKGSRTSSLSTEREYSQIALLEIMKKHPMKPIPPLLYT